MIKKYRLKLWDRYMSSSGLTLKEFIETNVSEVYTRKQIERDIRAYLMGNRPTMLFPKEVIEKGFLESINFKSG